MIKTLSRFTLAFFIILSLGGCFLAKKPIDFKDITPPNGIEIKDNFYCDKTEISNINWLEYLYWTKRVFGSESTEFQNTLPDTTVWSRLDSCLVVYDTFYLRHPAYRDYPVVGISQQQAIAFSKWRTDRVFEQFLIAQEVITWNDKQNDTNYFSVENYFSGKYNNTKPDTFYRYYPRFRLPDMPAMQTIVQYSDSVMNEYYRKCKSKKCKECKESNFGYNMEVKPCNTAKLHIDRTSYIWNDCVPENGIDHLTGNVAEWLAEDGVSAGGGWIDQMQKNQVIDTILQPNAWTGFRNVCEWVEYTD